jgi:hypothetical protein
MWDNRLLKLSAIALVLGHKKRSIKSSSRGGVITQEIRAWVQSPSKGSGWGQVNCWPS